MKYTLTFKISYRLPEHTQSFLPKHINFDSPNILSILLDNNIEEIDEDLIDRGKKEIERELLRISIAEGKFYKTTLINTTPKLSNNNISRIPPGWLNFPLNKESVSPQIHWTANLETKLNLWEKIQNESSNPRLIYAFLNMICELSLSKNERDWLPKDTKTPTPYQEIKIIRNLLLHANEPNETVKKYLSDQNIACERNVKNSQDHCFHAQCRLYVLLPEVRKLLLKDLGFT